MRPRAIGRVAVTIRGALTARSMNLEAWLKAAQHDADQRGLRDLAPLLETLARSTAALRAADDEHRRQVERESSPPPPQA